MFKVNEYFEGRVKSLGFTTAEGAATIGVMAAGDYEFGTATVEVMTVVSGRLAAQLPGETAWGSYGPGESFTVEAGKKFKVKAGEDTAYLCRYK